MCLCTYKIYILYYLDSLAFSTKRVKKLRNLFFFVLKITFFNDKELLIMRRLIDGIAGEKKKIWRRLNEK